MNSSHNVVFEPFRIDLRDERLWRGSESIALTRKAFSVLRYLVEHPARLVTRDSLVESVWSRSYVTDAAVAMCIRELRQALGDNARSPRYIETVRGRGYRFIAPLAVERPPSPAGIQPEPATAPGSASPVAGTGTSFVGRAADSKRLNDLFERALQGQRQTVFIGGEAGIGKTTLVDRFLSEAASNKGVWIGRGQCIDHHGPGEPYFPILEAIGRFCRGKPRRIDRLRRYAPSWLAQIPSLLAESELEALQGKLTVATQDRMLRELAEAVEMLSLERPLVLVLEDLHWSDASTLGWLAYMTRRRDPAHLLLLGTYRPVDAILRDHDLRQVVQDLKTLNHCTELMLEYLSPANVAAYLRRRADGHPAPDDLSRLIHHRSGGNPLFMSTIVDTLVEQNLLRLDGPGWRLGDAAETLAAAVPENLRLLIELQVDQLDTSQQDLLEAACVAGAQFFAAAVAACLKADLETVDRELAALSRRKQFIRFAGDGVWPDGTAGGRYEFIHTLYREVLYQRVAAGVRVRLHRSLGLVLEAAYAGRTKDICVELAAHSIHGLDPERAIKYLAMSADNALHRGAHQEAMNGLELALKTLGRLPDTPGNARIELDIQSKLGAALIAAKGYAWPQTARAFIRARQLCAAPGNEDRVCEILFGVSLFHLDRGELDTAHEIAREAVTTAKRRRHATDLLLSHRLLGTCRFFLGDLVAARRHLETALDMYRPGTHRHLMYVYATDIRISILCWLNRTHALLGHTDQALSMSREAVAAAAGLDHSHSLAYALRDACFIGEFLGDLSGVEQHSSALLALAAQEGFAFELEEARIHHGWHCAMSGHPQDGIAEIERGLKGYAATGSVFQLPFFLTLSARARARAAQHEDALKLLDESLQRTEHTGERWFKAEVLRVRGEMLLELSRPQEAEVALQNAIAVAGRQQAKALELRATVALARLWRDQGKSAAAFSVLDPICQWFAGTGCTNDLSAAASVLGTLRN